MKAEDVQQLMEQRFKQYVDKDQKIHQAFLTVHSDKLGTHLNMAAGESDGMAAHPDQPYYTASVGKLLTSTLVGLLVQEGKLNYHDLIMQFLEPELLQGLHVYKGKEYTQEIRVRHLLNHTSGLHDYFLDKPKQGKGIFDFIIEDPARSWSPKEIIHWSKTHLSAHFPPGQGFHYSDTGYCLLGLIIESVTGKPVHQALSDYIFTPLGMQHAYLAQYSQPAVASEYRTAPFYYGQKKIDVEDHRGISADYAGGGIVAPARDLLTFMQALVKGQLLTATTFEKMKDWAKFGIGIDYGYGFKQFRPIPLLMPRKFVSWGHAGFIGSFLFYHPKLDAYLIGNLNQCFYHRKGIMLMFRMINMLAKCAK
jgi:D-alanyl-D-alanine carboxypeptidase